ncbi:hypothetical protein LEP1GSC005_0194 [Leptospira santarosai str. ST188]|nr:hypothetical protein LEP1GSC005_0194 [Leptospira santarosai str. ST188]
MISTKSGSGLWERREIARGRGSVMPSLKEELDIALLEKQQART